jgi:protein-tyrosine phosphatase
MRPKVHLASHPTKTKTVRQREINRGRHIRFTDIHSHILPGVDDGVTDIKETLKMVEIAYNEGIRTMVCTPHYIPDLYNINVEQLRQIFDEVVKKVKRKYPDFRLVLGHEINYTDNILKTLKDGEALTLGDSNYCLIEFNIMAPYETIFQAIRTLAAGGYRPIISHIEKYECLNHKEDLWQQLIHSGAYTQMNYSSIPGNLFDRHNFYCLKMIEKGLVHFLGTNCHNTKHQSPEIKHAIHVLDRKIDKKIINRITQENGQMMLDNQILSPIISSHPKAIFIH